MSYILKEKWFGLSLPLQMANIGADVGRAINWKEKNQKRSLEFFEQAMALIDLTIEDKKNHTNSLKEICRVKESLADYFVGRNEYKSSDKKWNDYFSCF